MKIKLLVPPIIVLLIRRILGLDGFKEYSDFSTALRSCSVDGYQNKELCNMIADKTVNYISCLKNKPHLVNPKSTLLLSAILKYMSLANKNTFNILDFGGACGVHYYEIRDLLPKDIKLKWYIVETEQMVKSALDRELNNEELSFVSSVKEIQTRIDFIHSSGTLQCCKDPYEIINLFLELDANWIFFNRMIFNEIDRELVVVQKSLLASNGPGKIPKGYRNKIVSYPNTIMSFKKFNSKFTDLKYILEWIFEEQSGSYKIKNNKFLGKGLLYIKSENNN